MKAQAIAATVLAIASTMRLAHGFDYASESNETTEFPKAELATPAASVNETQTFDFLSWSDIGLMLTGGLFLILRRKT
ncbi:MAG TPA: hypothetical protein VM553_20505 [Dongiaceae bacterium]|nr:hypothetical protein [Dongiaceae bacterium]